MFLSKTIFHIVAFKYRTLFIGSIWESCVIFKSAFALVVVTINSCSTKVPLMLRDLTPVFFDEISPVAVLHVFL